MANGYFQYMNYFPEPAVLQNRLGHLLDTLMTLDLNLVGKITRLHDAAARAADGVSGAFDVRVAQVSATYGAGPATGLTIPG